MEGQGQILTVTAPRGELLSKHKHRDGACTLRRLYSKRLDTKLVDITAMQEVAARNREHTHAVQRQCGQICITLREIYSSLRGL